MIKAEPQYLAEVKAWNPDTLAEETLFFHSGDGWNSSPTDPYPSKHYLGCLQQPGSIVRTLFDLAAATRGDSRIGFGNVVLLNGDQRLDDYVEHGFDGRTLVIRRTEVPNPVYSDFIILLSATMEQAEFNPLSIVLKLRDRQFEVTKKLQTTKYLGTGLGTLEGSTDLKGKVKPVALGTKHNVNPYLVEAEKLIYQVNDGAISSIPIVRDRGRRLGASFAWSSANVDFFGYIADPFRIVDMAYGNGIYVVVTAGTGITAGGIGSAGTLINIYTSTTGLTNSWTKRTSPFGTPSAVAFIRFGGGTFIITTRDNRCATSTDGITWTVRAPGLAFTFGVPMYNPNIGRWCILGGATFSDTATSDDGGVTWTVHAAVFPSAAYNGVVGVFGNGRFVIATGQTSAVSADGVTWTSHTISNAPGAVLDMAYNDDQLLFLASGNTGLIMTSDDGESWILHAGVIPSSGVGSSGVACGIADDGLLMVWPSASARAKASSDRGKTWSDGPALGGGTTSPIFIHNLNDQWMMEGGAGTYNPTVADSYASQADLLDNSLAPHPGTFKVYLAGGCFRLGASPDAPPTCDVVQGASTALRTTAQLASIALARAGQAFVAGDLTTLDGLNDDETGFWTIDDSVTVADVLDFLAGSIGSWWGVDRIGQYRIKLFTTPSASPVTEFTLDDVYDEPTRIAPIGDDKGLPYYRVTVRHTRNLNVQTTDLDHDVTADDVLFLSHEWREAVSEDSSVLTAHPLAPELFIESGVVNAADALTEAARQLALRKIRRDRLTMTVKITDAALAVDLGDTIDLVRLRYGSLPTGLDDASNIRKRYVVTGINVDCTNDRVTFNLWGGGRNSQQKNVVGDTGTFLVSDLGVYVISGIE